MSEQNLSQKDSPGDSSFPSIHWISLWQASGNDWSWMVKQTCLSNPRSSSSINKKEALNQQSIIIIEIILTIALLLFARYIESSSQFVANQSQKSSYFESSIIKVDSPPEVGGHQ